MRNFKNGSTDTRGQLSIFRASGRNGYTAIDQYTVTQDRREGMGSCERNIDAFSTKKQANATAGHLGSAYARGWIDATGAWPQHPTDDTPGDVALYRLRCPVVGHSVETSDDLAPAANSAAENNCSFCGKIAEIIAARNQLRRLAAELVKDLQEEDEKRGRYAAH